MKCGDIVQLKSGGPEMTVTSVVSKRVEVLWFIDADLRRDFFHIETLIKRYG